MADQVTIIDHGKIIAQGTPAALKKKARAKSLEEAFIKLTGHTLRDEDASDAETMRMHEKNVEALKMSTVYIMWLRQLKRYFRSKPRMIGSLGQPLIFLLAFGFGFGRIYSQAGEGDYLQFLAPGRDLPWASFSRLSFRASRSSGTGSSGS